MTNYRTIVTFKNGTHKILRMTRDLVAKFVTLFREMQKSLFNDLYAWNMPGDEYLLMNRISNVKFIDEYTGDELLSLS